MSNENLNITVTDEIFKISIDGRASGNGTNNHNQLSNLDYENAGHTGFQKSLVYDADFKAYEIE